MSLEVFKPYAELVIILVAQQIHGYLSSRRAAKALEAIAASKAEAELAAIKATAALQRAVAVTAVRIEDTKQAAGEKLETIHTLVNGNLQAEKNKNLALSQQVAELLSEVDRLRSIVGR